LKYARDRKIEDRMGAAFLYMIESWDWTRRTCITAFDAFALKFRK